MLRTVTGRDERFEVEVDLIVDQVKIQENLTVYWVSTDKE